MRLHRETVHAADSVSTPLTLVAPPSTLVAPPSPRPWNPFHTDSSRLTINVALDPPGRYTGGTLLGCFDAQVVPLPRLCLGRSSGVSRVHLGCISCASRVRISGASTRQVRPLPRGEGDATTHESTLLHGVSTAET